VLPIVLDAASSIGKYADIKVQQAVLAKHLSDSSSLDVKTVGVFSGIDDLLKFMLLSNPTVNGERLAINSRNIASIDWVEPDVVKVNTSDVWQLNDDQGNPKVLLNATTQEIITFLNCSDKVVQSEVFLDPSLSGELFSKVFSQATADGICEMAALACPGRLFPYQNFAACVSFMETLPVSCNDGYQFLQGNTAFCRLLQASAARIDPLDHCQNLGVNSTKCVQSACTAGYYANSTGFNIVETQGLDRSDAVIIVAFLIILIPSLIQLFALLQGYITLSALCEKSKTVGKPNSQIEFTFTFFRKRTVTLYAKKYSLQLLDGSILLDRVSFSLRTGDLVAVLGPSGSGKTTLLKALLGQVSGVEKGKISVEGSDASLSIAYVDQFPTELVASQPNITVRESLVSHANMIATMRHKKIDQTALIRVTEVVMMLEMTDAMDTKLKHLSGGQQKRWHIARELLTQPEVLLLDEPTSGLDSTAALNLMLVLKHLAMQGMAIITTIHQPGNAILESCCSHVMLMRKGGSVVEFSETSEQIQQLDRLSYLYLSFKESVGWLNEYNRQLLMIVFSSLDNDRTGYIISAKKCRVSEKVFTLENLSEILSQSLHGNAPASTHDIALALQTASKSADYQAYSEELDAVSSVIQEFNGKDIIGISPPWAAKDNYSASLLYISMMSNLDKKASCVSRALTTLFSKRIEPASPIKEAYRIKKPARKKMNFFQWVTLNINYTWEHIRSAPTLDLVVYYFGTFLTAGLMCLLFPFVKTTSLGTLYYFPASLLISMAVLSNLVFLNQVGVRLRRERAQYLSSHLSTCDSYSLRVVSGLMTSGLSNWVAMVVFFFFYYFVVRWYLKLSFRDLAYSFISLKLLLGMHCF